MLRKAKRSIVVESRPSVCNVDDCGRMCWVCSSTVILSNFFASREIQHLQSSTGGTPTKFVWNMGVVLLFLTETLQCLWNKALSISAKINDLGWSRKPIIHSCTM